MLRISTLEQKTELSKATLMNFVKYLQKTFNEDVLASTKLNSETNRTSIDYLLTHEQAKMLCCKVSSKHSQVLAEIINEEFGETKPINTSTISLNNNTVIVNNVVKETISNVKPMVANSDIVNSRPSKEQPRKVFVPKGKPKITEYTDEIREEQKVIKKILKHVNKEKQVDMLNKLSNEDNNWLLDSRENNLVVNLIIEYQNEYILELMDNIENYIKPKEKKIVIENKNKSFLEQDTSTPKDFDISNLIGGNCYVCERSKKDCICDPENDFYTS